MEQKRKQDGKGGCSSQDRQAHRGLLCLPALAAGIWPIVHALRAIGQTALPCVRATAYHPGARGWAASAKVSAGHLPSGTGLRRCACGVPQSGVRAGSTSDTWLFSRVAPPPAAASRSSWLVQIMLGTGDSPKLVAWVS